MTRPRALFAALALVTVSTAVPAQSSSFAPAPDLTPGSAVEAVGPRLEASRAGVVIAPSVTVERVAPAPMYKKANIRGRNLMIIGGAAILGGAIVGGDAGNLVSLGGLGVGLYGLYVYLN